MTPPLIRWPSKLPTPAHLRSNHRSTVEINYLGPSTDGGTVQSYYGGTVQASDGGTVQSADEGTV